LTALTRDKRWWYHSIGEEGEQAVPAEREVGLTVPERHKPGEKAPHSGQYPIIDPKGGNTGVERTVTKGEPFPPTPKKGQTYGTPDKTKH